MTENSHLVAFQHHYSCGHKSQTMIQLKSDSAKLFDILGSESYCIVCAELRKVIRIILFDLDSNKWL